MNEHARGAEHPAIGAATLGGRRNADEPVDLHSRLLGPGPSGLMVKRTRLTEGTFEFVAFDQRGTPKVLPRL